MSDEVDISLLNLDGKITEGDEIASGGFSTIYRGTLLVDGKMIEVAIKSLKVQGVCTSDVQDRLRMRLYREVLVWRELIHPNIVPLFGYLLRQNRPPVLVSPWYPNGDVIQYLKSNPSADRRALARDVVSALIYCHSIPMVHGDLKGGNVLVDDKGRASLCDFGMSQFIDETSRITGFTTANGNGGGTVRFMSPELIEDKPKTAATDMWAAGCLVVQLLTDDVPYQEIHATSAVYPAILGGKPPSTNGKNTIGGDLWDCIKKCWSMNPSHRPTASDMGVHFSLSTNLKGSSHSCWDKYVLKRTGQPQYEPEWHWVGQLLSPSFGHLTSDTIKYINKELKITIAGVTKEVLKIPNKDRNWDNITEKFNNSIFIKKEGYEMRKADSYTQSSMQGSFFKNLTHCCGAGTDWFEPEIRKFRMVSDEVKAWIETLISDPDILACTRIDMDAIAKIVATTGSAIAKLEPGNSERKNYYQKSINEFGVLRYPSYDYPHFKLYSIKLFAWTECRGLVSKNSQSGIRGEFRTQIYVPNEEIIAKIRMEIREKVLAEIDSYFD